MLDIFSSLFKRKHSEAKEAAGQLASSLQRLHKAEAEVESMQSEADTSQAQAHTKSQVFASVLPAIQPLSNAKQCRPGCPCYQVQLSSLISPYMHLKQSASTASLKKATASEHAAHTNLAWYLAGCTEAAG